MDEKQAFTQIFNLVADKYDNPSARFFPSCANKIVDLLKIRAGEKVLDIATGTGMVALAAAQSAGHEGQVLGIDLAEKMLDRAQINKHKTGLDNVDFQVMDAEQLEFKNNYFDVITCSYGLFFMPDMSAALKNWLSVLKPGGRILFTSFAESAFQPLSKIFLDDISEYGVTPPEPRWLQLSEQQACINMISQAGFESANCVTEQLGYHLDTKEDWWQLIVSAGYRGLYEQIDPARRDEFQQQHLTAIDKLMTSEGLWLDVNTNFTSAVKPA